jgi:hypothetical protein
MNIRATFAWLVFASFTFMLGTGHAVAQTCRWDGTAPFCSGECGSGETEMMRAGSGNGAQGVQSVNTFGSDCATGTKALCCKTPGRTCRWDGTAPFCDGECKGGETAATPPPGSSSGAACWTGSKVYCCHVDSNPASVRQFLQGSPEYSRFAAIWEKVPSPPWQARHGLTSDQYQQEFNKLTQQGYRLIHVSGYAVGGQDRYAAIWEKSAGPDWQARHGLTSDQYQDQFNQLRYSGYRLTRISGWGIGDTFHYAAIWEKIYSGPDWVARHGMLSDSYQEEFNFLAKDGYRLKNVSGYQADTN